MRTYEEYRLILKLWEQGENKSVIAKATGIPRATVRDCINRYGTLQQLIQNRERATRTTPDFVLGKICDPANVEIRYAYAYLLGMYLGDGYIVRNQRVYFLRITLDTAYPGIIRLCAQNLNLLLPQNKVNVLKHKKHNYVEVICTHKFWPEIFPQHGDGPKHKRDIVLEDWQQDIVDRYPLEFFRGLYHSDGTRFSNVVNGKDYPRYGFTNHSDDIRRLFCDTCDKLGLHWTTKRLGSQDGRITDVFISRRKDVEYLDRVIGPKC